MHDGGLIRAMARGLTFRRKPDTVRGRADRSICEQAYREGENMIHVVATIKLQAGTREKFLRILKENVPRVQAEQGCRAYAPAVDIESGIPVQAALRPDVVTIIEAWDSLEDLRVHLKAPHMLSYREKVQGLVKNVSIHVLTPA
jgi:quinol monooxygenase YgiN